MPIRIFRFLFGKDFTLLLKLYNYVLLSHKIQIKDIEVYCCVVTICGGEKNQGVLTLLESIIFPGTANTLLSLCITPTSLWFPVCKSVKSGICVIISALAWLTVHAIHAIKALFFS